MPPRRKGPKSKSTTVSSSTITKTISLKTRMNDFVELTTSDASGFEHSEVTPSESQAVLLLDPLLPEEQEEEDLIDDASEILHYYESNYCWNPHETDCFTFPDEYVLANKFCKLYGLKTSRIRLSWLSEEDVSLPCFFTIYELNAHNTDCFSEESEYVGAINYYERLRGPVLVEDTIYQINELKVLSDASRNLTKFLTYSEHLIMMSKSGEEIGQLELTTKTLEIDNEHVIELHLESHGIVQDVVCGMKTVSRVLMPSLQTISYQHHEFIEESEELTNNQLELIKTSDGFELNRTESHNGKIKKETKKFTQEEMENFVSDVSSILVQRLFILVSKPDEEYKFDTLTTDCELCPIYFKHLPTTRQVVCGNVMNILGLKREIHYSEMKIFEDHIYFNKAGRILSQFPIGFPVVYRMLDLLMYQKALKNVAAKKRRTLVWKNDLELWSKYENIKQNLFADYNSYVQSNPDLQALLADFMQSVLIHTPQDVIEYAKEYFNVFK